MHHSEERYLELLDSFNGMTETYHPASLKVSPGVTEPYHLTLLDSLIWRYWTVSPDVTRQFHLALLNRITWCYWTVSPGVIGLYHLTLLDGFSCHYWTYLSFTLRYWNLSPDVTEQQSSCSTCNGQFFNLRLIAINMTNFSIWWQRKISWSIFSKKFTN